ncbi:contact-dependent growth inhibition system immunity protein [Allokutzneria sp. A3M-2-11 16]|uniref:contact-dependent growth inhibition system immunity protein n=1 Tax=Allokutzneria sp. A3M-2-11 16 TaxID=2962043 RepID=UPI0035A8B40A
MIQGDPIAYLAQGYFHQDYDLEAETPIQVVAEFRRSEPVAVVDSLRVAVRRVLIEAKSHDELIAVWLERAQASYDPRDDGIEICDWFRMVERALL